MSAVRNPMKAKISRTIEHIRKIQTEINLTFKSNMSLCFANLHAFLKIFFNFPSIFRAFLQKNLEFFLENSNKSSDIRINRIFGHKKSIRINRIRTNRVSNKSRDCCTTKILFQCCPINAFLPSNKVSQTQKSHQINISRNIIVETFEF